MSALARKINSNNSIEPNQKPQPNWKTLELPNTWADGFDFSTLTGFIRFFKHILGARQRVELPALPQELLDPIPKYALQEFHNVPNGNYSNSLTPGYIKGFDISMLNTVHAARQTLAKALANQHCVLDIGCAGGKTAAAIKACGVSEVWALDPSPYLLKQAAMQHPNIQFTQGSAENTGFDNARFDGISVCFVFHEIPPRYAEMAIKEIHRILQPGGILAIAEPSAIQYRERNWLKLLQQWGWKGIYFRILAQFVFEPFIPAWHEKNIAAWLATHGFTLLEDTDACPIRTLIARKR